MTIIVSFGISFLGIVALLAFKSWEVRRGIGVFPDIRIRMDKRVVYWKSLLYTALPICIAVFLRGFHASVYYASEFTLRAVRFLERRLLRFVNMVKGRRGEINKKKGSASLFLAAISSKEERSSKD